MVFESILSTLIRIRQEDKDIEFTIVHLIYLFKNQETFYYTIDKVRFNIISILVM